MEFTKRNIITGEDRFHLNDIVADTALYEGTNMILQNNSLFVLGNREEYRIIFSGGTVDTTFSFFFGRFDTEGNRLITSVDMGDKSIGIRV